MYKSVILEHVSDWSVEWSFTKWRLLFNHKYKIAVNHHMCIFLCIAVNSYLFGIYHRCGKQGRVWAHISSINTKFSKWLYTKSGKWGLWTC